MREVGVVEPRGCAVGSQGPAHDDERLPSEPGFLGLRAMSPTVPRRMRSSGHEAR